MRLLLGIAALAALVLAAAAHAVSPTTVPVVGQYRKDYYLPYDHYQEYHQPDPVDGGRVHLVMPAKSLGTLASVQINGAEMLNLPSGTNFSSVDWAKTLLEPTTGQLWISLHSQNRAWLDTPGAQLQVVATDSSGKAVAGAWTPTLAPVFFTWATPTGPQPGAPWVVHLQSNSSQPLNITELSFDGVPMAGTRPALPVVLAPNSHLVLLLTPPGPKARGAGFTLAATLSTGQVVANGGRVPEARFPIEAWPSSVDCPTPFANTSSWQHISSHGIDTVFYAAGNYQKNCGGSIADTANKAGAANLSTYFLWTDPDGMTGITEAGRSHVSAIFLADENDGQLDHNVRDTLSTALEMQDKYPWTLTYQGGKTNRHNGLYAGICDIQGLDFYIAACAPTIVPVVQHLPVTASYAYIRNARNNHMPLPAMTYSQLYGSWAYEPNAVEIILQVSYVLASGAKGITLFQSKEEDFAKMSSDWEGPVKDLLLTVANPTVREVMRTGDVGGLVFSSSVQGDPTWKTDALVEVIRSHEYVAVILINTKADDYSNLLCHVDVARHWKLHDYTVETLTLNLDAGANITAANLAAMREAKAGALQPAQGIDVSLSGGQVVFKNVALSADSPMRLFLIPYQLE